MASIRQEKVGELVKRELSELFRQGDIVDLRGTMVSVTTVRMSPDLRLARAYLSIFVTAGKQVGKEGLLEQIKAQTWAYRKALGQRVGKQLRSVPDLAFFLDDSLDYAERIDDLLNQ